MNRRLLLMVAMVTLLVGIWSGLLRLGFVWAGIGSHLPIIHGPLMVGGFLGTLISLERAVAIGKRWAYLAPLLTALGAVALLAGDPGQWGAILITAGSLVTVAIFVVIVRMQPSLFTFTIALGTVLWVGGNLLWLSGWIVPQVVIWWMGFLLFTIAGERLELSRLLRLTRRVQGLFIIASLIGQCGNRDPGRRPVAAGRPDLAVDQDRRTQLRDRHHAGGRPPRDDSECAAPDPVGGRTWHRARRDRRFLRP